MPSRVHSPGCASVLHRSSSYPALGPTSAYDGRWPRQKGDPMIILLALPVIAAVALVHRYLLIYARRTS